MFKLLVVFVFLLMVSTTSMIWAGSIPLDEGPMVVSNGGNNNQEWVIEMETTESARRGIGEQEYEDEQEASKVVLGVAAGNGGEEVKVEKMDKVVKNGQTASTAAAPPLDFNSTRLEEIERQFKATAEETSDRSFWGGMGMGYGGWGMRPTTGLMSGCTWIMNSPGKAVCCRYTCHQIFYCYYY